MAQTAIPTDMQIVQVPIDDLHPDPANPRKISDSELDNPLGGKRHRAIG